jgi:hypothetical protein
MKYIYCFILLFFFSFTSQAQLVLNNGIIINVNGGVSNVASSSLVLNNPPATPITRAGTSTATGGIMLESEWNRIVYYLSNGTTAITVPYVSNATGSWVQFPLAFKNVTAGANTGGQTGAIRFSSKHSGTIGTGWDNTAYMPTQVGNMYGTSCGPGNNSANVVDRFWVIEPVYYSTRPAMTLDFTYIMSETDVNGGNTAGLASLLQPQRFDTLNPTGAICGWNGFPVAANEYGTNTPAGSITATSVGTLTGVTVTSANFFPDWTLANYLLPLPVEIINYSGLCENKSVTLKWTSANEINSAYYTIEKSSDGSNFSALTTVAAVGNSSQTLNYTYIDVSPGENTTMYYRLSETDKSGNKKTFKTIVITGCSTSVVENGTIYSYNNEVNVTLFSLSNQNAHITAYDVTGRLIYENQLSVIEGNNHLKFIPNLAQGVYLFEVKTEKISIVKRILIEH